MLQESDLIVFAIPSQYASKILRKISKTGVKLSKRIFVSVTKGIERRACGVFQRLSARNLGIFLSRSCPGRRSPRRSPRGYPRRRLSLHATCGSPGKCKRSLIPTAFVFTPTRMWSASSWVEASKISLLLLVVYAMDWGLERTRKQPSSLAGSRRWRGWEQR